MKAGYGAKLRKYIAENTNPEKLLDFGSFKVFKDATVDVNIIIWSKIKDNLKASLF